MRETAAGNRSAPVAVVRTGR